MVKTTYLKAKGVKVNLAAWYDISGFFAIGGGNERHLGSSHGYIFINGCSRNWSFFERDFIKNKYCEK